MKKLIDKSKKKYLYFCDKCGEQIKQNHYEIIKATKRTKKKVNDLCENCYKGKDIKEDYADIKYENQYLKKINILILQDEKKNKKNIMYEISKIKGIIENLEGDLNK